MLVSIIIPVYNGEKYLDEAIQSAIRQTYQDIEIIVVDDGSTDLSDSIARTYEQEFPVTVVSKSNGGTASALNMGIKLANGKWIKWLSADDVLLPDAIENMMNVAGYGLYLNTIYYTNYHIIDENGKHLRDYIEPEDPPDIWKRFYGNGSTSLIHRELFNICGLFDERLPHSEDYEFWLRATQLFNVKLELIPIFTINYRMHPDQLTNKVGGKLDRSIKDSIRKRLTTLQH